MKYAICIGPLDQTFGYVPANWPNSDYTIVHSEAMLLDTREEAQKFIDMFPTDGFAIIEEVVDEAEFRSREDTW